ncbi:unnamed protein product [Cunninghamella blakesleeana]
MHSLKVLFLFVFLTLSTVNVVEAGTFSTITKSAQYALDVYKFVKEIFRESADRPQVWDEQSKLTFDLDLIVISSHVEGRNANFKFMIDNKDERGVNLASDLNDYLSDGNSFNQIMTKLERNSLFNEFNIQAVTINGDRFSTVEFCRDRPITTCMNNKDTYIALYKSDEYKWNEEELKKLDEQNTNDARGCSYNHKCR